MKGIYRKALLFVTLVGSLTFSFSAAADEQFIELGITKSGEPVFLNTESIRGPRFAIFMAHDDGMMRLHYRASCGESRLFRRKTETFSANGIKISEDKIGKEIKYRSKTAAGKAMKIVCKKMGARGW
jgi:hypothetical protein